MVGRERCSGSRSRIWRRDGEAKREEAFKRINEMLAPFIEFCEKMGFTIDTKIVYEAIQAAWYKLNLDQILAGVKQTDTQESK